MEVTKPKVSVIIPCYNVEKYLRQCLDSVLNQTLKEIEVLCINDGSTDGSQRILEEYAANDKRITIINQENKGVAAARNIGIRISKGEYIAFIDSDDYIEEKSYYEILYTKALNEDADVAKSSYKDYPSGIINTINLKIKENKENFCATFSSAIYRSHFLKSNNIVFPNLINMEDPVFAYNVALKANKIVVVDDLYIIIRKHSESATAQIPNFKTLIHKWIGLNNIITLANQFSSSYESYKFVCEGWLNATYNDSKVNKNPFVRFFIIIANMYTYTRLKHIFKSTLRTLFAVGNTYSNNKKHKVITIFGIKIKFSKRISFSKVCAERYKSILKSLRKDVKRRKIKVCFLVSETAKWNAQNLYDEMEKSNIFEPFVVVTNLKNLTGRPSYSHLLEFYKSRVDNVEIGWDENTKRGIDLKLFNPDIVFYQQPWDLYDNQNVKYVSNFALTCHFSYAMSDAISCVKPHYNNFYSILYKYFVFSEAEKEEYKNKMQDDCKNVLVFGHPKLDIYKDYDEHNYENKYVIYAPHHSLEDCSLNYATFRWSGKYILEWAQKHPEFNWVFKPHPRLKQALIFNNIMTEEEVENYYSEWAKIGWCYNDGAYFDLFKNSKCLITDCCSFLIEYLPTCKPVIHLRNPKGTDYIPSCKTVMESYYQAWNIDELNKYLDEILIKNNDYMKNVRIETQKKLKLEQFNSTEKIINFLKQSIGKNK